MTAITSLVSFIDSDSRFKAMPAKRQQELFENFYQTMILCIRAFILENLKPEDREELQLILNKGNEIELYNLGKKKIPHFEQKVEKLLSSIKDAFIQETHYDS